MFKPHRLKNELRIRGLRLFQIRQFLNDSVSETKISRMLNGLSEMCPEIEAALDYLVKKTPVLWRYSGKLLALSKPDEELGSEENTPCREDDDCPF